MNPMGFTFLYLIALLFSLVVAYLCGSIPFAIIIGKGIFGVDVRQHGSGNTGSTNVMRVLGVKAGIVVFICDTAKGQSPFSRAWASLISWRCCSSMGPGMGLPCSRWVGPISSSWYSAP